MKLILNSHPDITLIEPVFKLVKTIDYPESETFVPCLEFEVDNSEVKFKIYHELPPQPYVNGSWTDVDVDNAIKTYFESIEI
jgi:hypothetical protein